MLRVPRIARLSQIRPSSLLSQRQSTSFDWLRTSHHGRTLSLLSSPPPPLPSRSPHLPARVVYRPILNRIRTFHCTPPRRGLPLIPLLAVLKTSTALEVVRTAARIILTIVPVLLVKNLKARKYLKKANVTGVELANYMTHLRKTTKLFHIVMTIPIFLFGLVLIASLERVPLTGRWRMILLSPEEEDDIATQLEGAGWYNAVGEILAQQGPVRYIHPSDWRYAWVRDTLRQLESAIPILIQEGQLQPDWIYREPPEDTPLPPPADYPLRPRPRASEYLHLMCENICSNKPKPPLPHSIPGPPYSLLVVDKPEASNAFSYGFGPNGGGGIVVYSGFLNEILARQYPNSISVPIPEPEPQSWLSTILFGPNSPPPPVSSPISDQQTTDLAVLLAHELSHLVLSHHLETLSSATVFIPGAVSIFSDMVRVLIFPITMIFGPFVNDYVAQAGRFGSAEVTKIGEYCTSVKQEIEADVVSARLLAHAGFDARAAVDFWEHRGCHSSECANSDELATTSENDKYAHRAVGRTHPLNGTRVDKLKAEIVRWEVERRAALVKLDNPSQRSSINLLTA